MVVLSLHAMILLTGLFQSIKFIQGLRCYQCDHHGTLFLNSPCDSYSCDEDEFHNRTKAKFYHLIEANTVKYDQYYKGQLQLEEFCYLRIQRPIPFNGHSRGCYLNLIYNNVSKPTEFENLPMYDEWILCSTDNCNDKDLPDKQSIADKIGEMGDAFSSSSSDSHSQHSLALDNNLSCLLTVAVTLAINSFHCY